MVTDYSQHYSRRKALAALGEESAANYLNKQEYTIVARNWRAGRWGEVDLIAWDAQKTLVFVEVKTRMLPTSVKSEISSLGFEAINVSKQRKIMRSACRFQQLNRLWSTAIRFDAIVVIYSSAELAPQLIHIPNAFAPFGTMSI